MNFYTFFSAYAADEYAGLPRETKIFGIIVHFGY